MQTEREMVERALNETKSALKKIIFGLIIVFVLIIVLILALRK